MKTYTFEPVRGTYYNSVREAAIALADCMSTPNAASVELTDPQVFQGLHNGVRIKIENGAGFMVSYVTPRGSFVRYLKETDVPTPLEAPWPPGPDHNAQREGWSAFFDGRGREACPFPPARDDLQTRYREGWDAAKKASELFSDRDEIFGEEG